MEGIGEKMLSLNDVNQGVRECPMEATKGIVGNEGMG